MAQIVWYGAGNTLMDCEKQFAEETGLPVCISCWTRRKWHTFHEFPDGERCEILPLDEVQKMYPDYELWMALSSTNIAEAYRYLTEDKSIAADRIRFFGGWEYRLGCDNLQHYIYISSDNIKTCAHFPYTNHFSFQPNQVLTEEDIVCQLDRLEAWRRETIGKLRRNEKTTCHGCSALHWGFFPKEPRVEILGVGPNFKGDSKCNCNCFYCNQNSLLKTKSNQKLGCYDIHRIAGDYYDTLNTAILADGEPTIHPDIEKICEYALDKGWSIQLNTNALVYKETIAKALASNKNSFMAVALDAGSAETYQKIKRVNGFDRVLENVQKYKELGCNIFDLCGEKRRLALRRNWCHNRETQSKTGDVAIWHRKKHARILSNRREAKSAQETQFRERWK